MIDKLKSETDFVSFRSVNKAYGAVQVVRDLNLDVSRGEFLTMLGPSGSGKTTSLMMLAGFEQPTSGAILLDGKIISAVPPHRRGIGVVFQNYALFPHMSVLDNIKYPLRARGARSADCTDEALQALTMVRLEALAGRKPSQLSGGQQQRVAVARALVFKPNLVLMDEPLGALDKHLREQLQDEIKDIHRRTGVTIIYVTHDQSEALTMSDRIGVFNGGRLIQIAAPGELYRRPIDTFVASFLGESNLFQASVVEAGPDASMVKLPGASVRKVPGKAPPSGSNVALLVRPEHIRLLAKPTSKPEGHLAVIQSIAYHGDHLRVKARSQDLGEIAAKLPVGSMEITPALGEEVGIDWRDEDSVVVRQATG